MKIAIYAPGRRGVRFRLPTSLFLNRISARIAAKAAQTSDMPYTSDQIYALMTAVKDFKRKNGDWTLVEVQSANGEYVKIVI